MASACFSKSSNGYICRKWSWFMFLIFLAPRAHSKELSDVELLASKPSRCTYAWAYEMYGAHCAGLQLTKIPNLRAGIEILEFTENRLRELKSDTFSSYSSIKFLYLSDNAIFIIEENAFSPLVYLETLDLSRNAIMSIPNSMFNLPSLRNLYMSGNALVYLDRTFESLQRPVKAPLENLDISDCRIINLPDFGILPQLSNYNVSHNQLLSLPVTRFAETCNLRKIDLTGSIDDVHLCDLKPAIRWLDEKEVYFALDSYSRFNSLEFENCPRGTISDNVNNTYNTCKAEYVRVGNVRTVRRTWLTICGGLAGFLVAFMLLLYLMHRRNVAQTKKTVKPISVSTKDNYSTTATLLHVKT